MSPDSPLLSLHAAFTRQFVRHMRSLMASPADVANPLLFFFMVVTLFPLGLGPDPDRLAAIAPGILWVVALLASLMVSAKLFASDFEDGSLEQLALAPYPLAVLVLAEVAAHWLTTGFLLASGVAAVRDHAGSARAGPVHAGGQFAVRYDVPDAHWRGG